MKKMQNFMRIMMMGMVLPEMARHISKIFEKPEKRLDMQS